MATMSPRMLLKFQQRIQKEIEKACLYGDLPMIVRPTMDTFVAFIRDQVGDMSRVTNDNIVRIDGRALREELPSQFLQNQFYAHNKMVAFVHQHLDLRMDYDFLNDCYDVWFDPR